MAKSDDPLANFDDKRLRLMIEEIKRGREETELWKEMFDGLSSTLFGISGSVFFKQVPKSIQQITMEMGLASQALSRLRSDGVNLEKAFTFKTIVDNTGTVRNSIDLLRQSVMGTLSDYAAGANDIDAIFQKMQKKAKKGGKGGFEALSLDEQQILMKAVSSEGLDFLDTTTSIHDKISVINSLLYDGNDEFIKSNRHLLKQLSTHESIRDILKEESDEYEKSKLEYEKLLAMSQDKMRKPTFLESLSAGLKEYSRNFGKGVVTNLFEVDNALHEIQRNTGVMMGEGVKGLQQWSMHLSQFGMSVRESGQLIEGLGAQLGTTDMSLMMEATESFASLPKALGISADEISTIAGEMMRMGHSVEGVKDAFVDANVLAKSMGINSRSMIKQISKNLDKMRQFGFEGGIKSLTLMAAKAEKMRIQVDEIFDVAKRARTIEGAMDMASQLQLAGGSFSNINPMELLSAARKGPDELGKILTTMGTDVGRWNEKMGTYDFDPIDVDRLQIVADATEMSLDAIQKSIQKNAEVNKKTELIPDSMFNSAIKGIDNMDAALAKSQISDFIEYDTASKTMKLTTDEKKLKMLQRAGITDISQINDQTMHSFLDMNQREQKTLEEQAQQNMSLKESFDAFAASLTNVFTGLQPIMDGVTNALNGVSKMLGDSGKQVVASMLIGIPLLVGTFNKLIKPLFSALSSMGSFGKKAGADSGGIGGLAGSMRKASDEAGGIKMGNILKFSAALGIIGLSVIGFMAGLNAIGGTPGLTQLAGAAGSMLILGGGIWALSKLDVKPAKAIRMSLAMAVLGAAMIPFAYAMSMMQDINWKQMLASIGIMALSVIGLVALGALLTGPGMIALGVGAEALIVFGASMAIAGAGLMVAAVAFESLANVNWDAIMKMGTVMFSVAPAMLAFGVASLAMANPIAIIGMGIMAMQLLGLSLIMGPLSKALSISSLAMGGFVASLDRMKAGVSGSNVASVLESVADAIYNLNEVLDDSDMDKISSALSSIHINVDMSGLDGLQRTVNDLPAIMLRADTSNIKKDLASLPATKIMIDTKTVSDQMKALPSVSVKFDLKALHDAVEQSPSISVSIDQKKLMDDISSLHVVVKTVVDASELSAALESMPKVTVGVDEQALNNAKTMLSAISIELDVTNVVKALETIPAMNMDVDTTKLMNQLSQLPLVKLRFDISNVNEQLATLRPIALSVDEQALQQLSSLPKLVLQLDKDSLSAIPTTIYLAVDDSGVLKNIMALPPVHVLLNKDDMDKLSSLTVNVGFDSEELMNTLSSMPSQLNISLDIDNVAELERIVSSLRPIEIGVDSVELKSAIEKLRDTPIMLDASELNGAISSLPAFALTADFTSITEQLKALPPVVIGLDRTEVDKMIQLLSSINVSLDTTAIERSVSNIRVGVDTSNLDKAVSGLNSIDVNGISRSLASIEATIKRVGEEKANAISASALETDRASSRAQMELLAKLVEAIDKLASTSGSSDQKDRKLVVELQMNGRDIKSQVIRDTSIVT